MQKLIYNDTDYPSFVLAWVRPLIEQYFELVHYDPAVTYDHNDAVLVTYASRISNTWYQSLCNAGHRLVVDHLWDSDVIVTPRDRGNELELRCPNWMWYLACLEFEFHGYKPYLPNRQKQHAFLMLMNNPRWHRDAIVPLLHNVLDRAIYSYNAKGISIAGDKDPSDCTPWQRYMNPDWYNTTAFSVVVESYMRDVIDGDDLETEVSEKIFKPLAYYHPFVVAGSMNTLTYLREQGFETYNTWFDESYDLIENDRMRLCAVCNEIDRAVNRWHKEEIGWDTETVRRTQHNHNHFFDRALVESRFIKEIIEPVQEFLCKP